MNLMSYKKLNYEMKLVALYILILKKSQWMVF
jgi:hypothetical protein